jgi:hypothetical protein
LWYRDFRSAVLVPTADTSIWIEIIALARGGLRPI